MKNVLKVLAGVLMVLMLVCIIPTVEFSAAETVLWEYKGCTVIQGDKSSGRVTVCDQSQNTGIGWYEFTEGDQIDVNSTSFLIIAKPGPYSKIYKVSVVICTDSGKPTEKKYTYGSPDCNAGVFMHSDQFNPNQYFCHVNKMDTEDQAKPKMVYVEFTGTGENGVNQVYSEVSSPIGGSIELYKDTSGLLNPDVNPVEIRGAKQGDVIDIFVYPESGCKLVGLYTSTQDFQFNPLIERDAFPYYQIDENNPNYISDFFTYDEENEIYKFTMPNEDLSIRAVFSCDGEEHGSISYFLQTLAGCNGQKFIDGHYECKVCGLWFHDENCTREIPYPDFISQPALSQNDHVWAEGYTIVQRPYCTTDGFVTGTCTVCHNSYENYNIGPDENWHIATNVIIYMPMAAQGCEKPGNKEYYNCKDCGNKYLNKREDTVEPWPFYMDTPVTDEDIVVDGHSWRTLNGKHPSCTEDGYTNQACSKCEEPRTIYYNPTDGRSTLRTGHNMQEIAYQAPTCYADGNIHYFRCSNSRCSTDDKLFDDIEGEKPLTPEEIVLKKRTHDMELTLHVLPNCNTKECHIYECKYEDCDYIDEQYGDYDTSKHLVSNIVKFNKVEETCTTNGRLEYWQCRAEDGDDNIVCGRLFRSVVNNPDDPDYPICTGEFTDVNVLTISASHKWDLENIESTWSFVYDDDRGQYVGYLTVWCECTREDCDEVLYADGTDSTGTMVVPHGDYKAPTCLDDAWGWYTCSASFASVHGKPDIYTSKGSIPNTALGHDWGTEVGRSYNVATDGDTLVAYGRFYVLCSRCDDKKYADGSNSANNYYQQMTIAQSKEATCIANAVYAFAITVNFTNGGPSSPFENTYVWEYPNTAKGHSWRTPYYDYDVRWNVDDEIYEAYVKVTCECENCDVVLHEDEASETDGFYQKMNLKKDSYKVATCTQNVSGIWQLHVVITDAFFKDVAMYSDEVPDTALGHVTETIIENVVEPTCTTAGGYDEVIHCTVCGGEFSREYITVDAHGHAWHVHLSKSSTCINEGYSQYICNYCGDEDIVIDSPIDENRHRTATYTAGKDATCTEDGVRGHYKCNDCGRIFLDRKDVNGNGYFCEYSNEIFDASKLVIPAKGHTPGEAVIENRVEATETTDGGYDTVIYCTVCGEELSREHTTIDAHGHELEYVPEKEPTTEEDGHKAYYECKICGERFADAEGTIRIESDDDIIIPKVKSYSVVFDVNGHGIAPEAQEIVNGGKVTKPENPAADGWSFGGWYTDKDCSVAFDFDTEIEEDVTLYAKWTETTPVDPNNPDNTDNSTHPDPFDPDDDGPKKAVSVFTVIMVMSAVVLLLLAIFVFVWILAKRKKKKEAAEIKKSEQE